MLTEREYRPVTHFALAGGDRTRSRGAIELVLCFRVEVIGALSLRRQSSLVSLRFAADPRRDRTAVDRFWVRRSLRRYSDRRLSFNLADCIRRKPA